MMVIMSLCRNASEFCSFVDVHTPLLSVRTTVENDRGIHSCISLLPGFSIFRVLRMCVRA